MKRGDHIYIYWRDPITGKKYTHHGIYYGDGKVIHYYKGKIQKHSLSKFGSKSKIKVKSYKKCNSRPVTIKRAKSRKGERLYNLIFNNCEHFAYWCKTGKHKSKQVDTFLSKELNELDKKFQEKVKKLKRIKISKLGKVKFPKRLKLKIPKIRF